MMTRNLFINGDKIFLQVDEEGKVLQVEVPGCKRIDVDPYLYILEDGRRYMALKYARDRR
jgi:hypothetical protein